jgi:predicted DNA-binding transcriptional regulator AlpA
MSQSSYPKLDDLQLLDVHDLSRLLKRSQASLWRDHENGAIPKGLRIGKRAIRWRASEISKWLEAGCPIQTGGAE